MKLSFYGAAGEVTGACYLFEAAGRNVLIDCGMYQGSTESAERNAADFPFPAKDIDAVIITHAHVDHIGRLPKLFRDGFRGKVFLTPPTRDLANVLLEDAMNFQSEDAPTFDRKDIAGILGLTHPVDYGEEVKLAEEFIFGLHRSGHILGSAFVQVVAEGRMVVFSGDIGNDPSTLLPPRVSLPGAEILITESTYGNRTHKHVKDRVIMLERSIEDVASRGGTLMIPAFATERTQEILYEINDMIVHRRVPIIPVFVDSPLAIKATEVFTRYEQYYRDEVQDLYRGHPHLFHFKTLTFTPSVEESKGINAVKPPKVIIAGSGMSTGGRILHHEKRYLPDKHSILLVTGYQAAGSLGRRLLDHTSAIKIHNEEVNVNAEIRVIDGYSAHADQEQLVQFVDEMRDTLKRVFVVHGEPAAAMGLQQAIQDRLGVSATVPRYGDSFEL